MQKILVLLLVPVLFVACKSELEYEQVNESTDCFTVVISPLGDDDDSASDEERGMPSDDDDSAAADDDDSAADDDDSAAADDDDSAADDDDDSAADDDDDSAADDDDSAADDDDDSAADDDDDSAADDDDDITGGDDDDSASEVVPESLSIDLHARPGYFDQDVVGVASMTPGGGPAGTRFDLAVVLEDTGTAQGNPIDVINRVSVIVDNGVVTLNEFDLSESPADERRFVITLQTGGDPAQVRRTDEVCVALYTEI
jgi:hypothetical protein